MNRPQVKSRNPGHRPWIISSILGSATIRIGGVILGFTSMVFLARILGPTEFGIYSYAIAFVSLLAIPVQMGLPTLIIRETAHSQQKHDWARLIGLWRWALLVTGILSLGFCIIAFTGLLLFSEKISEHHIKTISWSLLLIPVIAWVNLRGAALTGLSKVVIGQLPANILRPGILLILVMAGHFFQIIALAAVNTMALTVLAGLLALIIASKLLRHNQPVELLHQKPVYNTSAWLSSTWTLALISGIYAVNQYTDILMLGWFATPSEVGVYRIAVQGGDLVAFVLHIVNMVIAPQIARLHSAGKSEQLQQLVTHSARLIFFVTLPVALILILNGKTLLELVFGVDYVAGSLALSILAIGQLFSAAMGSVGILLNMTKNERAATRGISIAALTNIALNTLLIPSLGINGAAIATAISVFVWNIYLWKAVRYNLNLDSTIFSLRLYFTKS